MCCSNLNSSVLRCSALQRGAVTCVCLRYAPATCHSSVLQSIARVLQCVAVRCSEVTCVDLRYELATCYANGRGCMENQNRSTFWYTQAANQNHAEAMADLAFRISGMKRSEYVASLGFSIGVFHWSLLWFFERVFYSSLLYVSGFSNLRYEKERVGC